MNSSSGQCLEISFEQAIKIYSQLNRQIQDNNKVMRMIVERNNAYQEHADEDAKKVQKILKKCSNKERLEVIKMCQANYMEKVDFLIQLKKCGIQGIDDAISECNTFLQFCRETKQRFEKIIEKNEELDKKQAIIAKIIAEQLAQEAQQSQEIIGLQEHLHSLEGKYRVFCKIMPTPQNQPKSQVIQRISYFSIKILEKITHYAVGVSKEMVEHPVDFAFPESVKQKEVFNRILYLLRDVFAGQNCSIMCYGQSGSGKSYTMTGLEGCLQTQQVQEDSGLVPRILEEALLTRDKQRQKGRKLAITLQFYEKGHTPKVVRSGFSSTAKQPKSPVKKAGNKSKPSQSLLKESSSNKKKNEGEQYLIKDLKSALKILKTHIDDRKVKATPLNPVSSRSHLCIILRVLDLSSQKKQIGMLSMIDLAGHGSSKPQIANEQKQQNEPNQPNPKQSKQQKEPNYITEETSYINKSLSQVSQVLRLIRQGTPVVWPSYPFLMRYLQPYLEGSRGIVIVTLSSKQSGQQANRASMEFINDIK